MARVEEGSTTNSNMSVSAWSGLHSLSTAPMSNTYTSFANRTTECRLSLDAIDVLGLRLISDTGRVEEDTQEIVRISLGMREGLCFESLHYKRAPKNQHVEQWDLESKSQRWLAYVPFRLPRKCTHKLNRGESSSSFDDDDDATLTRSVPIDVDDDMYVLGSSPESQRSQLRAVQELLRKRCEGRKLHQAMELLKRIHRSILHRYGPGSLQEATSLFNLANIQLLNCQYSEARKNFDKCGKIFCSENEKFHPFNVACKVKVGICYFASGNLKKALRNFCSAADLRKSMEYGVDNDKYDVEAKIINNIGVVLFKMGSWEAGIQAFKKAASKYDLKRDISGTQMIDNSVMCSNIGCVLIVAKKYSKAMYHFKQALNLQKKILASDHPICNFTGVDITCTENISKDGKEIKKQEVEDVVTNKENRGIRTMPSDDRALLSNFSWV